MSLTMVSHEVKKAMWGKAPKREDAGPSVRRPLKIGPWHFLACFLLSNMRATAYMLSKVPHTPRRPIPENVFL